jgi:hypothetical protein
VKITVPYCTVLIGWDPASRNPPPPPPPSIWAHIRGRNWSAKIDDDISVWPIEHITFVVSYSLFPSLCTRRVLRRYRGLENTAWSLELKEQRVDDCNQCSGSGSSDPYLWLMDPHPALFVRELQDTNKKCICLKFFCLLLFFSFFADKKLYRSHKTAGIKAFLYIFAWLVVESQSVSLTSGSGRPKNLRIRLWNTDCKSKSGSKNPKKLKWLYKISINYI